MAERERLIEGITRAKISSLAKEAIDSLHQGQAMVSDNIEGNCSLRAPTVREAVAIQDMQDDTKASVWHAIRTNVPAVGDILVMLYVTEDTTDWVTEREELGARTSRAYVSSMPYGSHDDATVSMRLTSGGLYVTYIRPDTDKLLVKNKKKAIG